MVKVEASLNSDLLCQLFVSDRVKQAEATTVELIHLQNIHSGRACLNFKWLATGFPQALP
jgi:hypothetical protein